MGLGLGTRTELPHAAAPSLLRCRRPRLASAGLRMHSLCCMQDDVRMLKSAGNRWGRGARKPQTLCPPADRDALSACSAFSWVTRCSQFCLNKPFSDSLAVKMAWNASSRLSSLALISTLLKHRVVASPGRQHADIRHMLSATLCGVVGVATVHDAAAAALLL